MAERELEAKFVVSTDRQALDNAKAGTKELEQSLKRAEQQANRLRESGEKLAMLGARTAMLGAAITAPMFLAARNYVQQVGMAEQTSRRWLISQQRMEQSQLRMGRVMADSVAPYIERVADLTERVAALMERHPEIAQAALASGVLISGLGTAMMTLGMVRNIVGTAQWLGLASGGGAAAGAQGGTAAAAGAAGAAGATAVFMVGASAAAGAAIGIEISRALGYKGTFVQGAKDVVSFPARLGLLAQALAASGMKEVGQATGADNLVRTAEAMGRVTAMQSRSIDEWRNGVQAATPPLENMTSSLSRFGLNATQATMAFAQFQKQQEQAERNYEHQVGSLRDEFREQDLQAEKRYNSQRGQIAATFARTANAALRDLEKRQADLARSFAQREGQLLSAFAEDEARAEASYYADRLRRSRDFGIEMARLEEDYQREQRRLREDHEVRLSDLVRQRDARAVLTEMRDYELQRQRNEEDYRTDAGRRDADYAQQLADQEEAFAEQRAARQEALAEQLADLRESLAEQQAEAQAGYDERMAQAEEDRRERLAELERSYRDEKRERAQQQNDRLAQLGRNYRNERRLIQDTFDESLMFMQTTSDRYVNWLKQKRTEFESYLNGQGLGRTGSVWGYAAGGYATGLIRTGERGREFVLNADTTKALERDMGALTQERILQFGGRSEIAIAFEGVPAGISQAGLENVVREVLTREISAYVQNRK